MEGRFELADLTDPVTMVSGNEFELVVDGDVVTIGGATIEPPAIEASNGIIHVISSLPTP